MPDFLRQVVVPNRLAHFRHLQRNSVVLKKKDSVGLVVMVKANVACSTVAAMAAAAAISARSCTANSTISVISKDRTKAIPSLTLSTVLRGEDPIAKSLEALLNGVTIWSLLR
jgi:hypothetical protein